MKHGNNCGGCKYDGKATNHAPCSSCYFEPQKGEKKPRLYEKNYAPPPPPPPKEKVSRDTTEDQEGKKFDEDKPRFELIPPEILFAIAQILTFGASKYGDRNWEKGMKWGRVFGALMRHMWCWWGGKGPTTRSFLFTDLDLETKMSHLWHAACCIAFLVAYEERDIGEDDRARGGFSNRPTKPEIEGRDPELVRQVQEGFNRLYPHKEN